MGTDDLNTLLSVEFEVFGQVQENEKPSNSSARDTFERIVLNDTNKRISWNIKYSANPYRCFFTKYCKDLALQLGISGWVKNTKMGTIVGKLQGRKAELEHMLDWLSATGSPGCKIDRCELRNWVYLTRFDYNDFSIRF